jgi:hypothetical protein
MSTFEPQYGDVYVDHAGAVSMVVHVDGVHVDPRSVAPVMTPFVTIGVRTFIVDPPAAASMYNWSIAVLPASVTSVEMSLSVRNETLVPVPGGVLTSGAYARKRNVMG